MADLTFCRVLTCDRPRDVGEYCAAHQPADLTTKAELIVCNRCGHPKPEHIDHLWACCGDGPGYRDIIKPETVECLKRRLAEANATIQGLRCSNGYELLAEANAKLKAAERELVHTREAAEFIAKERANASKGLDEAQDEPNRAYWVGMRHAFDIVRGHLEDQRQPVASGIPTPDLSPSAPTAVTVDAPAHNPSAADGAGTTAMCACCGGSGKVLDGCGDCWSGCRECKGEGRLPVRQPVASGTEEPEVTAVAEPSAYEHAFPPTTEAQDPMLRCPTFGELIAVVEHMTTVTHGNVLSGFEELLEALQKKGSSRNG